MTLPPWNKTITSYEVVNLYKQAICFGGGIISSPKAGCLEQCLGNAWTAEAYSQPEGTEQGGLIFACALMVYLARDHCFTDGNKRVAWACLSHILGRLNVQIRADDETVVAFVENVAQGQYDIKEALAWVSDRLNPIKMN